MTTRESQEDFRTLSDFIRGYRIAPSVDNNLFVSQLKVGHKRLFGLLTFVVEIEVANTVSKRYSADSIAYMVECSSDIAQSLFCWMHGAYKPSYLSLRSSIETFVKAVVGTEAPCVLTEKSMYQILDLAKQSAACGGIGSQHFSKLRSEYGDLCSVAHSATAAELTQVDALGMFPKFEETDAQNLIRRFTTVVDCIQAILLANNRDLLAKMHYRNRANVLDALTKDIKRSVLGVERE